MADNKMDYRDDDIDIDFDMTEAQKVEDRRSPDSNQDDFYEELSSADDQSHKKIQT